MAAFLHRQADRPEVEDSAFAFSDVGEDHRHAEAIAWLAESGITAGYEDGSFRPQAPLTRQAMAAFLHRQAEQ